MSVKIAMIAGVAENGVIGANGDMPWHISSDFKYFKRTTMGKPIVMGRKQFETVGKPLPGRANIVVTHQKGYQPDGVIVINDFMAAIEHAKTIAKADGVDEIMIIGGGEIYRLGMPIADRLYISHIALSPEGEVTFPEIDAAEWHIEAEPEVITSDKDSAKYKIAIYTRR